jgi:putative N6-adenine-specific DNA methylase
LRITLIVVGTYTLAATATFGLESVVASELTALGYGGLAVENGQAVFHGGDADIARCNLWLRSADRLLVRLAEFGVSGPDDVYEGVRSVSWRDFIPDPARIVVTAKSVRAPRGSSAAGPGVPTLQSVGKKAIVDALTGKSGGRLEETGPLYPVRIALSGGRAVVTLDTSGAGLHKRGYRAETGEAPLKETLAAGIVLLSKWDPSRPFADPLCGSGTIPIEAALIASNAAPGLSRSFAAEEWPHIPAAEWRRAREAAAAAKQDNRPDILAVDRDARVLAMAARNAEKAGVADRIAFRAMDLARLRLEGRYGCIVTNPPYAERIGDAGEVEGLYRLLGRLLSDLPSWSLFALCAHAGFQKLFGRKATKNRKLYNGNIMCYLHQYYGPLPE